jgi:hypothetical protein
MQREADGSSRAHVRVETPASATACGYGWQRPGTVQTERDTTAPVLPAEHGVLEHAAPPLASRPCGTKHEGQTPESAPSYEVVRAGRAWVR